MDRQVQSYIEILRSSGGVVTTSICLAVGLGIVTAVDKQLLSSNGGPLKLTKHWAYSLLRRMNMVKRKGSCTAKTHISDSDFEKIKDGFLLKIKNAVAEHDIPADLVYNWDHTGLNYVSVSNWTMEVSGSKKIPIVGLDDKRQITAVFAGTLSGDFLPAQLIYQGKTEACHPVYDFPLAWNITHSDNHWANKQTQLQYTKRVLLPHMKKTKKRLGLPESQQALCIFDVFRAQMSEDFLNDLKKHNISIVYVPPSCTDRLQPMDLTVQKVVKDKLKDSFQQWYASKITKQLESGKEICDLKPVDLRLSHVKPLSAKWIFDAHAQVKADRKLVFKGFEKAGIAEALDYEFEM